MKNGFNKSLVVRLVKYQRVLRKLKSMGFITVFSNNLGDAVGVTSAVVRKDFSLCNIPGNKRGGYDIDTLAEELAKNLGVQENRKVILVGCGRIGQALMDYREFHREGISLLAGFDSNPERWNSEAPIPVFDSQTMTEFVRTQGVEIGILAVPETSAAQVFDEMVRAGIRGFLNFTSIELKCAGRCDRATCPTPCTVSNVNIGLELENLFYLASAGVTTK